MKACSLGRTSRKHKEKKIKKRERVRFRCAERNRVSAKTWVIDRLIKNLWVKTKGEVKEMSE